MSRCSVTGFCSVLLGGRGHFSKPAAAAAAEFNGDLSACQGFMGLLVIRLPHWPL